MQQVWKCPKCGGHYRAAIPVLTAECCYRHNRVFMTLIEGEKVQPKPRKHPPRKTKPKVASASPKRPKATTISSTEQLASVLKGKK